MDSLISVIVPIYNAEKYLARCVDSVLAQTYPNLEILLIDDGSTDSSPQICDSYLNRGNIRVFHNENGGVGAARNFGMANARGEYIIFADSDDYCHKDLCSELHHAMCSGQGIDLAICGIAHYSRTGAFIKETILPARVLSTEEYLSEVLIQLKTDMYCGGTYNKLYRRSIIEKNALSFTEKYSFAEDFIFNLDYLDHVSSIALVDQALYFYQPDTENSLTSFNYGMNDVALFWAQRSNAYDRFKRLYVDHGLFRRFQIELLSVQFHYYVQALHLACKAADSYSEFQKTAKQIRLPKWKDWLLFLTTELSVYKKIEVVLYQLKLRRLVYLVGKLAINLKKGRANG